MGEILRHLAISFNTLEKIGDLRSDEEYTYLELGNFLTDVSQFRDPFANMSAKRVVWQKAMTSNAVLKSLNIFFPEFSDAALVIGGINKWMDDLLGKHAPPERRYGDLARYFEKMVLAITHFLLADDIPKKEEIKPALPQELASIVLIPSAEVDRVFRRFFTQYYPHEHIDSPPYVMSCSQRTRSSLYQRKSSGLIGYLEEYLRYLSEELSKLEMQWKAKKNLAKTHADRHDILASFGKLLHGVEDYFFHSNYVELHLWNDLRRTRPSSEAEDAFKQWFAKNALAKYRSYQGYDAGYRLGGTGAEPDAGEQVRWRRKLMRQLRYPLCESNNDLSTKTSLQGLDVAYTGGFESKDMFHTMAGALESLEGVFGKLDSADRWIPADLRQALKIPNTNALRKSGLVLIRTMFSAEERTSMAKDDEYLARQLQLHIEQIHSGVYERGVEKFQAAGYLNQQAKQAFLDAFQIDKRLEDSNKRAPGVGGFLIKFLTAAQDEVNKSRKVSGDLDGTKLGRPEEGMVLDERTDNGASGEIIGTHTLLSKDTPKNQPLYEDAVVLAKYASLAVATRMLTEVARSSDASSGLDWDRILQYYVRFPHARPGMWETQALAYYRLNGKNPAYADVSDRPDFTFLGISDADQRLVQRRNGTKRAEMEKAYIDLEQKVDT